MKKELTIQEMQGKYLEELNPVCGSSLFWIPELKNDLSGEDGDILIAHDWYMQNVYDYGLFTLHEGKILPLQNHPDCNIVNKDDEFIFEQGSLDYKGLVAIQKKTDVHACVIEFTADAEEQMTSANIIFNPDTNHEFKNKILDELVKDDYNVSCIENRVFKFTLNEIEQFEQINRLASENNTFAEQAVTDFANESALSQEIKGPH